MAEKFSIWTPHFSAGIVGLNLQKMLVALAFNNFGIAYRVLPLKELYIPGTSIYLPEYRGRVEQVVGDKVLISFDQRTGLSTLFGKGEELDGNYLDEESWIGAALREALEESGRSWDSRIIRSVSYREQPHPSDPYFNVVYLGNAVDFVFNQDNIQDSNIDKKLSGFYPLEKIPMVHDLDFDNPENKDQRSNMSAEETLWLVGTYMAAIRRIVAILLQLRQPTLSELGRPDAENADDLALIVLKQMHYSNLFSKQVMVMLDSFKRVDIAVKILEQDQGLIFSQSLVRQIAKNMILWLDDEQQIDSAIRTLRERLSGKLQGAGAFFWHSDLLGQEKATGSFDDFVNFRKARKERFDFELYDKKYDREFRVSDGKAKAAPSDGVYREEDDKDILTAAKKQWLACERTEKEKNTVAK